MSDTEINEEVSRRQRHQQLRNDFAAWFAERYRYLPDETDWDDEWQTFKSVIEWLERRQRTKGYIAEE